MSPRRTAEPALRLGVPDLFVGGGYEQALLLTFGPDLEFYERVLRRHFGTFRNQIVLADGRHLDRAIAGVGASGSLRHLNRSWLAGPIRIRHSAHAKAILLAGPEAGLLLVGSGNMNLSGYAGAGECFTPYRWTQDGAEDVRPFTSLRGLTDGMAASGHLDDVTIDRLGVFWSAYDWWHEAPASDGPVRHNLDAPLGRQFVDAIGGERVEQLAVIAPFHDPGCAALDRLATSLRPKKLQVLVQEGACSVDPKRLAAVAKKHGADVFTIAAAGDYKTAYLHAKVLLASTPTRDICLTGSANCSIVALWADQPDANIELANLTVGSRGSFGHLVAASTLTVTGPVDPSKLNLGLQDDGDEQDDDEATRVTLVDLQLRGGILSGVVDSPGIDPADVVVEVDGHVVAASITVEPTADGKTRFVARLTEKDDVAILEGVAVVTIRVAGTAAAPAVPYQLDRLREQDRRRVDAERLRNAAALELEDPDLEQALAALEEILIGDNVTRWTRDRKPSEETVEGNSIAWEQIDWAAVRRNPRFVAYGGLRGDAPAGSPLADYLAALSQLVRELLEPEVDEPPSPPSTPPDDPEDDEVESADPSIGIEGAEADDADDEVGQDQERVPRRQSPAARNRRLIRNFVRRNLAVLEQAGFRDGAGPGIVIPNVVILNWVCWWVATKDADAGPELVEERLRLWKLLWGDVSEPGYLAELDDEHQALVLERFDAQQFEAVTCASIADLWASIPSATEPAYRQLRAVVRRAATHRCWQVTASTLADAAVLANKRPAALEALDAAEIAARLWEAACEPHTDLDARSAIASAVGTEAARVTMSTADVIIDGKSARRVVDQATIDASFAAKCAVDALAAWAGIADLDFYRLKWDGGVAFYDANDEGGWVVPDTGDELDVEALTPAYPPWRIELDRLVDAAHAESAEAA